MEALDLALQCLNRGLLLGEILLLSFVLLAFLGHLGLRSLKFVNYDRKARKVAV